MKLKYLELFFIFLLFIFLPVIAKSELRLAIYNPDIPLDSAKETMNILSDIFSDLKLENEKQVTPIFFRYEKDFDNYIKNEKPELIWVNPDYYIKDKNLQYKDILQETADGKFQQSLLLLMYKNNKNDFFTNDSKISIPNFDDKAIERIFLNFPDLPQIANTKLIKSDTSFSAIFSLIYNFTEAAIVSSASYKAFLKEHPEYIDTIVIEKRSDNHPKACISLENNYQNLDSAIVKSFANFCSEEKNLTKLKKLGFENWRSLIEIPSENSEEEIGADFLEWIPSQRKVRLTIEKQNIWNAKLITIKFNTPFSTDQRDLKIDNSKKFSKLFPISFLSKDDDNEKSENYSVKAGDTLCKLAKRFYGNSKYFRVIAKKNNIQNIDLIFPSQKLYIPVLSSTFPLDVQVIIKNSEGKILNTLEKKLIIEG